MIYASMKNVGTFLRELLGANRDVVKNAYFRWDNPIQNGVSEGDILNQDAVFFLSTGRAGTKYITDILTNNSHFNVHHNPSPRLEYASFVLHQEGCIRKSAEMAFLAARFELLSQSYRYKKKYIETNNRITLFAEGIAELMPNSKFIHLIRNPAEFVRSGVRRGYYKTLRPEVSGHLIPTSKHNVDWRNMSQLEKIAWQWNEINALIENIKNKIEMKSVGDRVRTYRSDKIFNDREVLKELLEFTGWKDVGTRLLDKKMRRPVNIQKSGRFPDYNDWTPKMKNELLKHAVLYHKYGFIL